MVDIKSFHTPVFLASLSFYYTLAIGYFKSLFFNCLQLLPHCNSELQCLFVISFIWICIIFGVTLIISIFFTGQTNSFFISAAFYDHSFCFLPYHHFFSVTLLFFGNFQPIISCFCQGRFKLTSNCICILYIFCQLIKII